MQALRKVVQNAVPQGTRSMAGGSSVTPEARWGVYFPKATLETTPETAKAVRKEMIGFLLLGPASAALMVYDLIFGLVRMMHGMGGHI